MPAYFGSQDFRTLQAQADTQQSWTQLEIHDWPRYLHDVRTRFPFGSSRLTLGVLAAVQDPEDLPSLYAALGYLLTAQGQPIVYYGLEQVPFPISLALSSFRALSLPLSIPPSIPVPPSLCTSVTFVLGFQRQLQLQQHQGRQGHAGDPETVQGGRGLVLPPGRCSVP